jgi:hypothetical protein
MTQEQAEAVPHWGGDGGGKPVSIRQHTSADARHTSADAGSDGGGKPASASRRALTKTKYEDADSTCANASATALAGLEVLQVLQEKVCGLKKSIHSMLMTYTDVCVTYADVCVTYADVC